jgi:hypothetical protein
MCERLCGMACNNYLNLFMSFNELCQMLSYLCIFCALRYIYGCLYEYCMFSYQYAEFGKIGGSSFINRMFWFCWFCLTKPDGLVYQIKLSGFGRLSICYSNFICCYPPVMCITYYMFTHTHLLLI